MLGISSASDETKEPRATSECILGVSAEREEIGAGVGHGDDGKLSTRQSNVG